VNRRLCILQSEARPQHYTGRDILAQALRGAAREIGLNPQMKIPGDTNSDDIYLALEQDALPDQRLPGVLLYYNLEPLFMPGRLSRFLAAQKTHVYDMWRRFKSGFIHGVLDYGEASTRTLLERGVRAAFCPPGYHESIEINPDGIDPFEEGVYTLGPEREKGNKDRRWKVVEECDVKWIETRFTPENRAKLLITDGIHLNIHRHPNILHFGGMKIIQYYLANGRFVLSEPHWWSPANTGEHYVESPHWRFKDMIRYYWKNKKEREEIAANGQRFVRKQFRQADWLREALAVLEVT
jgi:hypothetical protein